MQPLKVTLISDKFDFDEHWCLLYIICTETIKKVIHNYGFSEKSSCFFDDW